MLSQKTVNDIAYQIVGCAIEVHKELGPGLLESVYEWCLLEELKSQGLRVKSQVPLPLHYKGARVPLNFRLDLLVEDIIIVELKAVHTLIPIFKAQLLTYLKLAEKPKGLIINFNCENITKQGLIPLVTEQFAQLPKL